MNCQSWQYKSKHLLHWMIISTKFKEPFYILTLTLLSLLLPLSFLIIARFSCYNFLLKFTNENPSQLLLPFSSSFLLSIFLYINPSILNSLVSIISLATLVHGLSTGKLITLTKNPISPIYNKLHLFMAWILLWMLQICVGLGVEGSIITGLEGFNFGSKKRSPFSRLVFFVGLHEIMLYWSSTIVKPVIDDTIYGSFNEETWVQKVAKAISFGTLWWWRLRDEVESLVILAETKGESMMEIGVVDLVGWWLYYLTVTIGMVRIVKGLLWVGMVLFCRRVTSNDSLNFCEEDNKV